MAVSPVLGSVGVRAQEAEGSRRECWRPQCGSEASGQGLQLQFSKEWVKNEGL